MLGQVLWSNKCTAKGANSGGILFQTVLDVGMRDRHKALRWFLTLCEVSQHSAQEIKKCNDPAGTKLLFFLFELSQSWLVYRSRSS